MNVFPVGYSTPGAAARIDELMGHSELLLIDTLPRKQEVLQEKYGNRYRWAGKYLGNLKKDEGQIEIADIETGLRGLIGYLHKGHDLILLYQCKDHVSHIVCYLQEMPDIKVVRDEPAIPAVTFEDVGEASVPSEYQALFKEYSDEVDGLPVVTPLWNGLENGYPPRLLEKSEHKIFTRSLLCSGEPKKIAAALEAMKRLLLKWDLSPAIAKQNREAYAAREQKKLKARADANIPAWENDFYRSPHYRDENLLQEAKERSEAKDQERFKAYQQKWRSNGYPIHVQEISNEEQVNIPEAVTCSTRFDRMWMEEHQPSEKGNFDRRGRYWCEKCSAHYTLMQIGAAKGYPLIIKGKDQIVMHAGEQHWLSCARNMGHAYSEWALEFVRSLKK